MNTLTDITDSRLRGMIDLCHAEVPTFALKFKDQSPLMKWLNVFTKIFNPEFMTGYTTTVGSTVYLPSEAYLLGDQSSGAEVLAHELVHMKERAKQGDMIYMARYFFPQILVVLSLLSLLAFWNLWFLLALLFLLALAPLPSTGRRDIELNGYIMSLSVIYWRTQQLGDADLDWVVGQFMGAAYYFMYPFRSQILDRLSREVVEIRTGRVLRDPLFRKVYEVMTKQPGGFAL